MNDLEKAAEEWVELEFLKTHESSISPTTIGFNNLRPDSVFKYAGIKGFLAGAEHARPKWVSVEEGLPELLTPVFFLERNRLPVKIGWLDQTEPNGRGEYFWSEQAGEDELDLDEIAYWMPLPPQPQERS